MKTKNKVDFKVIYRAVAIYNKNREKMNEEKIIDTLCEKYNYNYYECKKAFFDCDLYYGI